ncbi:MAG: methyltransferase domain-containing protein [Bacteroidetes bacterium]|nr:methyltransferase domain-containing protein [Bacteroidota bacterium]
MKEWFEDWFDSPYYHLLYQNRSEKEAVDFVEKIVTHFSLQAGKRLLDLACGKGRHAIAFAKHPLDVTGLDLSAESIALALNHEKENLHFYVHDMRQVFRTNYYDVVTNLFTSFGYFKSPHDHLLAAQSIAKALKPGGLFIIDFINLIPAQQHIKNHQNEEIIRGDIRFDIERKYENGQFIKDIVVHDHEKSFCFSEKVNSFSFEELKAIFQKAGLQFEEIYGDYHLLTYDKNTSPRMILSFRK